jgi:3-oxoacyl-[acyl-carrier protein] reductase
MDLNLANKVALVAGGGRGIGRAVAIALAREQVHVAVLSRTASELDETVQQVEKAGGRAFAVVADVANSSSLEAALESVRKTLGAPTILVISTAAHYEIQKLHSVDPATVKQLLDVDFGGAVSLCRLTIPDMVVARFGRIVVMGSLAARIGMVGATLYGAAKAGLEGLVRGIALDYGRRGVNANVCNIGFVDTERLRRRIGDDATVRERMERATSLRRLSTPEEIADVVTFMCSPRAASMTGAVVDVTGGAHLSNAW